MQAMEATRVSFKEGNRSEYYTVLKSRVDEYFRNKGNFRFATIGMWVKVWGITLFYFGSYFLMLNSGNSELLFYTAILLFGFATALVAFNIGHDASHGALSRKSWVNKLFAYSFNLIGANAYIWNLKHNQSHHTYTNVDGMDMDIEQVAIARLLPNKPIKKYHRYQHLYIPLLYPFVSLFLLFVKDFQMFGLKRLGNFTYFKHPAKEYIILILSKLFYFTYAIIVPIIVIDLPWWKIVVGIIGMHFLLGISLAIVLFAVHANVGSAFAEPDESGKIPGSWAIHQVESTVNFSTKNPVMWFLTGGLNIHIVHHLYPATCHIHYFKLAKIIRDTSDEFGVKHRDLSLYETMKSHLQYLKIMGTRERV